MINKNEYKMNPCKISSIPYWKLSTFKVPDNVLIVHHDDYTDQYQLYDDTRYFRLKHDLSSFHHIEISDDFEINDVDINCLEDLESVVSIINNCYKDIQVNLEEVIKWTKRDVFDLVYGYLSRINEHRNQSL